MTATGEAVKARSMHVDWTSGPHTVVRESWPWGKGRATRIFIPQIGAVIEFNDEAWPELIERALRDMQRAAAAPEMYEALKWAMEMVSGPTECSYCRLGPCLGHAALAKAQGQ